MPQTRNGTTDWMNPDDTLQDTIRKLAKWRHQFPANLTYERLLKQAMEQLVRNEQYLAHTQKGDHR